jgi:hypothetical protein
MIVANISVEIAVVIFRKKRKPNVKNSYIYAEREVQG